MQKNIFQQDNIQNGEDIGERKVIKVVKKKKKKVNKPVPIETQYQNNSLADMMNKMTVTPKSANIEASKVNSLGNKSFEEMINAAKKPRRMPPNVQAQIKKNQQEVLQSQGQEGEQQLIFHKPGTNILNNKNHKKKVLFEMEKQVQQLFDSDQEGVYNKLRHARINKQHESQRAREQRLRLKPKTKQQQMIESLKQKYNKTAEYSQKQLQIANAMLQPQYPQYPFPNQAPFQPSQSQFPSPFPSQFSSQYPPQYQSQLQPQNPPQFSLQQSQSQSPSPYESQNLSHYPAQHAPQSQSSPFPSQYPPHSQQYPSHYQYQQ